MTTYLVSSNANSAFACHLLSGELRRRGEDCFTVSRLEQQRLTPYPAETLVADVPLTANEFLNSPLIHQANALGVFIPAADLEKFATIYRQICRQLGKQPAPIFSGPPFPLVGDALVSDLMSRRCADLIIVHGERQVEEAAAMTFNWSDPFPKVITGGLWFMPERPAIGQLSGVKTIKTPHTLVVLAQNSAPVLKGAKLDLYRHLWTWAERSPEWKIMIQMDHRRQDPSSWTKDERENRPENLIFSSQEQLLEVTGRCSVCMTVSSPWIYSAMAWGRPSFIIGDYGIRSDQGNQAFIGSGSMHNLDHFKTLDDLLKIKRTNSYWLNSMGWGIHNGPKRLLDSLNDLQHASS